MEKSLILFKPDSINHQIEGLDLIDHTKYMVGNDGFHLIEEIEVILDEEEIREVRTILNEPSNFGENRKRDYINHLSSDILKVLVFEGVGISQYLNNYKRLLRRTLIKGNSERDRVIANIAHVPDLYEFSSNYSVIFSKKLKN